MGLTIESRFIMDRCILDMAYYCHFNQYEVLIINKTLFDILDNYRDKYLKLNEKFIDLDKTCRSTTNELNCVKENYKKIRS